MSAKTTASKFKGPISVKVSSNSTKQTINELQDQYELIRQDFKKLKKDLGTGYEMAKGKVEKTDFYKKYLKSK